MGRSQDVQDRCATVFVNGNVLCQVKDSGNPTGVSYNHVVNFCVTFLHFIVVGNSSGSFILHGGQQTRMGITTSVLGPINLRKWECAIVRRLIIYNVSAGPYPSVEYHGSQWELLDCDVICSLHRADSVFGLDDRRRTLLATKCPSHPTPSPIYFERGHRDQCGPSISFGEDYRLLHVQCDAMDVSPSHRFSIEG